LSAGFSCDTSGKHKFHLFASGRRQMVRGRVWIVAARPEKLALAEQALLDAEKC
jgi:hypothetical protein